MVNIFLPFFMLPEFSITSFRNFNSGFFFFFSDVVSDFLKLSLFLQSGIRWLEEDVRDAGWDGGASILRVSDLSIEMLMKHYTFIFRFGLISCSLLYEDSDSGLYSVTLFMKAVDDFKHKARENK